MKFRICLFCEERTSSNENTQPSTIWATAEKMEDVGAVARRLLAAYGNDPRWRYAAVYQQTGMWPEIRRWFECQFSLS